MAAKSWPHSWKYKPCWRHCARVGTLLLRQPSSNYRLRQQRLSTQALAINQTGWRGGPHLRMSDILWVAIMRSEIRSPTTKARSPILFCHLPRRYPHRREACITNHPIGNERMNPIVSEEIRFWMLLTPMDEAFVLCSCDHGIAPLPL